MAKAATMHGVKKYINKVNDPDNIIKNMFKDAKKIVDKQKMARESVVETTLPSYPVPDEVPMPPPRLSPQDVDALIDIYQWDKADALTKKMLGPKDLQLPFYPTLKGKSYGSIYNTERPVRIKPTEAGEMPVESGYGFADVKDMMHKGYPIPQGNLRAFKETNAAEDALLMREVPQNATTAGERVRDYTGLDEIDMRTYFNPKTKLPGSPTMLEGRTVPPRPLDVDAVIIPAIRNSLKGKMPTWVEDRLEYLSTVTSAHWTADDWLMVRGLQEQMVNKVSKPVTPRDVKKLFQGRP